jgi:hypothetical protein
MLSKMNTQKHRQNDEKSAAEKLPKNTTVLGAKTALNCAFRLQWQI